MYTKKLLEIIFSDSRITGDSSYKEIYFPSADVTFEYKAFWLFNKRSFSVIFEVYSNDCYKVWVT
jgi:hypothetical protein